RQCPAIKLGSEPDSSAQLNDPSLPGRSELAKVALIRINHSVYFDDVSQVGINRRELGMIECIERFESKLQLRCFVPQAGLLRYDQVPIVYAVRQPELVEALGASPEPCCQVRNYCGYDCIRIERPRVVLARVRLSEGCSKVSEIDYRSSRAIDISGIVDTEWRPRLERRYSSKAESIEQAARDTMETSRPRQVVNPARDEPVRHVLS